MSVTGRRVPKHRSVHGWSGISDTKTFQYLGCSCMVMKIACKPITTMGGVSSLLNTVLQISVTNQQGNVTKDFPLKLKIKALCIRSSNLITLNTGSPPVRIGECWCLLRSPRAVIFKSNMGIDLHFYVNKRQETLILVLRNLVLKASVTQQ
jgi:hypothetical protein